MQLTMEPLDEMVASARAMDEAGMDTIWLAEAYPWWRKHGMEAKSSTVLAGMIATESRMCASGFVCCTEPPCLVLFRKIFEVPKPAMKRPGPAASCTRRASIAACTGWRV